MSSRKKKRQSKALDSNQAAYELVRAMTDDPVRRPPASKRGKKR